jgi:putative two-component system response regulator
MDEKPLILVVDDIKANIDILIAALRDDYRIKFALNGKNALALAAKFNPDLILLDVMMPEMNGFEVCETLKRDMVTKNIPIIFVTANNTADDEVRGLKAGAVDYITKPIIPVVVQSRVKTHLRLANQEKHLYKEVKEKTLELFNTQVEIINVLGRAAEYKDNETGKHVQRVAKYSRFLALNYGISEHDAELLELAAPMHDIGKIGIQDDILKKKGRLDNAERQIMCEHARIGSEILGEQKSEMLQYATIIAEQHHEHWNGNGYPYGLKGEEIHIFGRIVAVADVFDALTSKRPYKEAWSVERARDLIVSERGKQFDPQIVDIFFENFEEIINIKNSIQDDDAVI